MQQLQPNTLLQGGKYKIEKVLGQGSFGVTYLAEHTSLGKKVAIKEFFMSKLNTRTEDGTVTGMTEGSLPHSYAQKFRKEATNLARMEHKNIVRVTDSFEENGTYYYVMDYIDGQNLNDYIKNHALTIEEATGIIRNVGEALMYMHDQMHMLHLDLKPGNIMRRSDGHIFLIDFGLSKHYDGNGAPETSTTIGLGTPGYAPIEQANQAKNGEFRPSIDVYALGATYYKLLTGKTPPPASDLVSDEDIVADELRKAGIPQSIASTVVNAMMPSVKKRTPTVSAFINHINTCNTAIKAVAQTEIDDDESTLFAADHVSNSLSVSFDTAISLYNKGKYKQALPILEDLATKGNADAIYRLGVCYYWGEGIERSNPKSLDFSKCMDLMSKASALGNSDAMLWMASYMYSNGEGTGKDDAKVLEYTQKAVDANNYAAKISLGAYYLAGQYVEKDEEKGSALLYSGFVGLQKKAFSLSREEMHTFGMCYHMGLGVEEDMQKAIHWYQKAADLGDPEAQNSLGEIYLYGAEGIEEDESKALKLFKLASDKNLNGALKNLGDCYYYGWGTDEDFNECLKWYVKAADEGDDEAMVKVGLCHKNGEGVLKNFKKAEEWFTKAKIKTNNAGAINYLGLIYEEGGFGITKNQAKAVRFYKEAAFLGYPAAQYNYGLSLINGEGVSENVDEGLDWIQKAADQNEKVAIDYLKSLDEEDSAGEDDLNVDDYSLLDDEYKPKEKSKSIWCKWQTYLYLGILCKIIVAVVKTLQHS